MSDDNHSLSPLSVGLLSLVLVLLSACGTLEVGFVSPTEVPPAPTVTSVVPETAVPTASPTAAAPTLTPHIDHWTVMSFPAFGISLERPPDWQPVSGYGDPQTGETRFAGVNGFVHVNAISGTSIDDVVASEAGHHLQPYGSQPIIENLEILGQPARLIIPSDDQSAGVLRQAAVIVRYPQPVEIGGQQYDFLILWADQEHIRAIAQTVQFIMEVTPAHTATPTEAMTWDHVPPGLAYSTSDGLWLVDPDEQPVLIHNNAQAILSPDGRRLISYDALQQDAWLIDRINGSVSNLTRTPARLECCFQWWPWQPDLIPFGSVEASAAQGLREVPYFLTVAGVDGKGYQVLDTDHPISTSSGQGSLALAPDGRTIAYGSGSLAWFYRHGGDGIERFDPVQYGLDIDEPFEIALPVWSPTGARLAWIVKGGVTADGSSEWTGAAVFDLATRTAQILHQYEAQGVGWPPAPLWSPDGQWLAFVDSSPSQNAGLWVARVGPEAEKQHLGLGGNPVWSPDGTWLAFQMLPQEGPSVYAVVEARTWDLRPLDILVARPGQLVAWVDLG